MIRASFTLRHDQRTRLECITEDEAAKRYGLPDLLKSRGDYGLNVVVIHGDVEGDRFGDDTFCARLGFDDVGTIVVDGTLRVENANISDRLMCLVVRGDCVAQELLVHATEMCVVGRLVVGRLRDVDRLLDVKGTREVEIEIGYGDKVVAKNGVRVENG